MSPSVSGAAGFQQEEAQNVDEDEEAESEAQAQQKPTPQPKAKTKAKEANIVAKAKAKSKPQPKSEAKKRAIAKVEQEEVEHEEEAQVDEPNAKNGPIAKAGATRTPRATKAKLSQAVLSPVSKVPDTTSPAWQQRHIYHKCMTAYPGKAGAFTDEQQNHCS